MSKTDFPEILEATNIHILYDKKKKSKDTGYRVAGKFAIKPIHLRDELPEFQTTSDELYIEHGTELHGPLYTLIHNGILRSLGEIELPNQKMYTKYAFYRVLIDNRTDEDENALNENDCLKFAESITSFVNLHRDASIFNKQLQQDSGPTVLQYKDVIQKKTTIGRDSARASSTRWSSDFGDSDRKNRDLLKQVNPAKIDHGAIPNEGELYAIVRAKSTAGRSAYHIAYVIYSDDTINITIEAEADNEAQYQPKICIYDRTLRNTFHCRWTGELYHPKSDRVNYLYGNGHTVVLTMQSDITRVEALFDRGRIPDDFREPVTIPTALSENNITTSIQSRSVRGRNTSRTLNRTKRSKPREPR